MKKTEKALAKTLGIEITEKPEMKDITVIEQPSVTVIPVNDQEEDYQLSRNTFRDLIRKGNLAMEDMVSLARESESPRAYEVLATMMKTISDTTKDLYDLQKKTKELKEDKSKAGSDNINVEKAVFVGSPSDLIDQIKAKKNNERDIL